MLASVTTPHAQQPQLPPPPPVQPVSDPNVNMVRGITFPGGDPYLQRQNEPSIAVSTRNPCHLLAGANDYRSVDIPFDDTPPPPNGENNISLAGDAWLGLFKSVDCGQKWSSTLLPGYAQDTSGKALILKGFEAGADPTVRAAHNGLFYYSGMVFNRGTGGNSKIFVARLVDNNNIERGDPIEFLDVTTIDAGTKGQFLDKPWMAVDVPRASFGPGSTLATGSNASSTCEVNGQQVPAGNVYMAWARFTGSKSQSSKLMFARSTDCGRTFTTHPVSNNQKISQGANIAIAPHDGTIYLTWREFAANGNSAVNMWIAVSSDGGKNFTNPKLIAQNVTTFDQIKSGTKFRSNALPAITADHQDRVYVAWAATGFGWTANANGVRVPNQDARIVMMVSSDRGKTFSPAFPIDDTGQRGHQMMPSLTFAAGKIQGIYYDAREDVSGIFNDFIDDKDVKSGSLRHTIDVRGVQADPAAVPTFVPSGLQSLEISKYRQWEVDVKNADGTTSRKSVEIGSNPPNLAMYSAGTMPFIGDYIDVSGLPAFPIQTSNGQMWQPNIGPINLMGAGASALMNAGFPTLPVFHAVWTDHRDVRPIADQCTAPPDPSTTGERNANIYTSRLTPGLFVGSPGNTKPLGYRVVNGKPTAELIQRGFVVFAQNTTDAMRFFQLQIMNQPAGGKATFRQFEKPGQPVLDRVVVSIPRGSTLARTVYATSTDATAQVLVNVFEVYPLEKVTAPPPPPPQGEPADPVVKKEWEWLPANSTLRGSILLNPDRTNPTILDPDVEEVIPQIATTEVHDPSMFDALFYRRRPGTTSRQLDVLSPDPESPDPESPDPESPDPESPDPESPDPESPDPESPDPESPDPESPDPESAGLLNTAISAGEVANSTITDINWRVHNSGNTTSAYRFRPRLETTGSRTKYQLIVTRRYMMLTIDPTTCKPAYKSQNQVVVNIENFDPKAPDPESPDPESPDPESPDPESPDPESPDPESPDPESANFFLAPDDTAMVTLRVFTPPDEEPPTEEKKDKVAAKTAAQAANTGQTQVSTAVTGPDLTLLDEPFTVSPAVLRPGSTASVTWTLTNRGTAAAVSPTGTVKTRVYFSTDAVLSTDDTQVGATVLEPTPFVHCTASTPMTDCSTTTTTPVPMPAVAGQYYVIVVTDDDNDADDDDDGDEDREVFEADELNNLLVIPVKVDAYQLTFAQQPSATTQDFSMTPPVVVAITHPDGGVVAGTDVPGVTLAIQNNPSGGTLTGVLTQPNIGGGATFTGLAVNNAGANYTLSATAPFATTAVSTAFTIEVDAPPVTAPDTFTVNEDAALNIGPAGVLTNDSDPPTKGIKPPAYVFDAVVQTGPANGTLTLNANGSFTYTPNAQFTGTDSFVYNARDGRTGNATPGTATITVTAVNDAPSFTKGADQTVLEDAGLQTVPAWATNLSKGPANESAQVIDFLVSNNNPALFSVQPAVSAAGTLTFQSAPNASGVAVVTVRVHDNGGTANGGVDTSAPQTFTITINGDNDPPVAAPDFYTINEDTVLGVDAGNPGPGLQGLLFNDTDPENNPLVVEYLTTTSNGTLLPHQNGSFSYTPNPHFFGTDSFTYRAFDGTIVGNTVTVTITVNSVNDVPSFTKGANQTVPMNAPAQSVFGWASAISSGAPNESAQTLTFLVNNDNTAIFSSQPAISATGVLTYTPRSNREGVATVTVQLQDNGGTANGGSNLSAAQTFTITITSAIQTYTVVNTNDSGTGSLRAAITNANLNGSADLILFNIPGSGVRTINLLSPLPAITQPVTVNATSQPGYAGTPLVELNGASAGAGANGFAVQAANVAIRGFVINRFSDRGILITGANALVSRNYIGTNAAGTAALGNQGAGVWVEHTGGAVIGGLLAGDGNVISGNGSDGVQLYHCTAPAACTGVTVAGNYVGTNAAGTAAIANVRHGIGVTDSPNHVIRNNLVSGNGTINDGATGDGIQIHVPVLGEDPQAEEKFGTHTIAGNLVGTDKNGLNGIPNTRFGVSLRGMTKATIGGPAAADRNVIAFNGNTGLFVGLLTTKNNVVRGNYIGVNATGTQAAGNGNGGIFVGNASTHNQFIDNVIAANLNNAGLLFLSTGHDNNVIQGNAIGTNAAGTLALGNQGVGLGLHGNNNLVSQNTIANNSGSGIAIHGNTDTGNQVTQNRIYDNGLLGIDLLPAGVTANDSGDTDGGANGGQNFPVLTLAFNNGTGTTIAGTIDTTPLTQVTIELFSSPAADPSGHGEGKTFLGTVTLATDASGQGSFSTGVAPLPIGSVVTATATAMSNTSEFSPARAVINNNPPTATDDSTSVITGGSRTFHPSTNDTDPDVTDPYVEILYQPAGFGTPSLIGPSEVAVVSSTGLGYFTGGNVSAATTGYIGILDLATNTLTGTIPLPFNAGGAQARVSQSTQIAYFRSGGNLVAVDGRPMSPTFNQILRTWSLGATASMAIDDSRLRLYVAGSASSPTAPLMGSLLVIDIDPESDGFLTAVAEVTLQSFSAVTSIAVNTVTNRIYVAAAGITTIDGDSFAVTLPQPGSPLSNTVAVNEGENLVYSLAATSVVAIDGVNNQTIATIALPGSVSGQTDTRMAIHQGTDRVYVRISEFPNASRLVVIDGKRTSPTFNTILTTLALGRENGTTIVAIDEAANRLIATSGQDLKSTVVDTLTNTIVGTVTSTQAMSRAAIDPQTHRAYVTGGTALVTVIDLATAAVVAQPHVGVELFGLEIDPSTHTALVSQTGATTALKRFGAAGAVTDVTLTHGAGRAEYVVRNPNTNRIYMLNGGSTAAASPASDALPGFVHVIDGATNAQIASVPVGPVPFGLAINPVLNRIYAGNGFVGTAFAGGGITVIDGVTNNTVQADISQIPRNSTVPGQISVARDIAPNTATGKVYFRITGGSPTQLAVLSTANVATAINGYTQVNTIRVNPALNRVYVGTTQTGTNEIHVFDGATDALITTIAAGSPSNFITNQSYLAIDQVSGRLYAADFVAGTVKVINGATNTVIGTVQVGAGPGPVAVNHALNRIYVGNAIDRTLSIIDGTTLRVVRTVPLPLAPVQIVVDETAPQSRLFIQSTANEGSMAVVVDTGSLSPTVTAVGTAGNGTVTLNADGSVTYTPTTDSAGIDSFTYTVTDAGGETSTATVEINIAEALVLNPSSLPANTIDQNYTATLSAQGGTLPYLFSLQSGTFPGGLTLSSDGSIRGSARASGTYTFTAQVRDSAPVPQIATRAYTITIGPVVVSTTGLPQGTLGVPYSMQLLSGGESGPVTWTINKNNNPLLDWLTLSPSGLLTGTPPALANTPLFSVTVTDTITLQQNTRFFTFFVTGPLTMLAPLEGVVLETPPAQSTLGGNGSRTVTLTSGALPPGLSMSSTGAISGVPLRHGSYPFTVQVTDCQPVPTTGLPSCNNQVTPQSVSFSFTWRVSARDQQGASQTNPAVSSLPFGGAAGPRYAQVLTAGAHGTLTAVGIPTNVLVCNGTAPVTFEIQRLALNGLPDGTTIATGTAPSNYNNVAVNPPVAMAIGTQYAVIVSSPVSCVLNNAATSDFYNGGDGYIDTGSGWQPLFAVHGRYDVPSVRSLIQPAMDVTYLNRTRFSSATTTLLNNGKVLIAGNSLSAELYDPVTGTSALTTGPMAFQRSQHTATLLADGRVLLAGGTVPGTPFSVKSSTAEIFDPATGLFTTVAGQLAVARDRHRAALLPDGRVLITGGVNDFNTRQNVAEIFDPVTGQFTSAGNTLNAREQHVMVTLGNGKVLVAAGYTSGGPSAELFDPATGLFTATTGSMNVGGRGQGTGTLLNDGRVLIAGGQSGDLRVEAELYDPATNTFAPTGPLSHKRFSHAATRLPDGTVLIAGGFDQQNQQNYIQPLATLERYDPVAGTFSPAGAMETVRQQPGLVTLQNGKALIVGGSSHSWMSGNSAELFDPSAALSMTPTTLAAASPGTAYGPVVLTAAGGTGPYSIAHVAGVLPAGLTYTSATGTIAGIPDAGTTGIYQLGFQATDDASHKVTQSLTLNVGAINTITSAYGLPNGAQSMPYSVPLTASGAGPVTWSLAPLSSGLPSGLTLSSAGVISGIPTVTSFFSFTVRAVDSTGQVATKVLSINVTGPMTITTTTLADGTAGSTYGGSVSRSNGVNPVTWSVTGDMPEGMLLKTDGSFDSTFPARVLRETGTFTFTVTATDSSSPPQVVSQPFTINVHAVDQTTFNSAGGPVTFGGAAGRTIAQTITVGANGSLTGIGLQNITCAPNTLVSVSIQRLTLAGLPDGATIASGSATANYNTIPVSPAIEMPIDTRFAFVVSTSSECTLNSAPTTDAYQSGSAYVNSGGGWVTLLSTDLKYDVPQFRTLMLPVRPVVYFATYRHNANVVKLADGRVLIAGAAGNTVAEIFDPATNLATPVAPVPTVRGNATATLLADGRVLLAGGQDGGNPGITTATAVIYDPAANSYTPAANEMSSARIDHTATRLADGRVLITGGRSTSSSPPMVTADVFDPGTLLFTPVGNMTAARNRHGAVLLPSGPNANKVLVVAGQGGSSNARPWADLFDPLTGSFTATANMVSCCNDWRSVAVLDNGNVLIAGGNLTTASEIYDAATGAFTATGSMLTPRNQGAASKLADGSLLIGGGYDQSGPSNYILQVPTLERFLPGSGTFVEAGSMVARRADSDLVTLNDGRVLIVAGFSHSQVTTSTAEIYDPNTALSLTPTTVPTAQLNTTYPLTAFMVSGGSPPYTFVRTGALPPGMTFDPLTMALFGTPTAYGRYVFALHVTDAGARSVVQSYTLNVGAVSITSGFSLAGGAITMPYSVQLTATGAPPVTWSLVSGGQSPLPPGLTLDSNGIISGTPTNKGNYSFVVAATDNTGMQAVKAHFISISDPLTITTTTLNSGDLFSTSNNCISTQFGNGSRTFSLSGNPPPGLTMSGTNSCFQGILTATGTYTFTVHATDQSSPPQTASRQFDMSVWAMDQSSAVGPGLPDAGVGSNVVLAQRVITGMTGTLRAVRLPGIQCSAGTSVTVRVEGLDPSGEPDGIAYTDGTAIAPFSSIALASGVFFAADAQFALVVSASAGCILSPASFDSYPGAAYYSESGADFEPLRTIDGYDLPFVTLVEPVAGFTPMTTYRGDHTATRLDNGKVLLAGGNASNTTELIDPGTDTSTPSGNMAIGRSGHAAVNLSNNQVLITGGMNGGAPVASAEIYDEALGTFIAIASMTTARTYHTATLLNDGKVLITGGQGPGFMSLQSAELFDPATTTFTPIGNMSGARNDHTATLLADGRVLIAGGYGFGPSAEVYTHASTTFAATDNAMVIRRGRHTATLLGDGTVLLAGGTGNNQALSSAELFNPASGPFGNGMFSAIAGMAVPRDDHSAVLLDDGSVLVAGGQQDTTCCGTPHAPQATLELYVPGSGWFSAGQMNVARYRHTATTLGDGRVVFAGTWGWSSAGQRFAEYYDPNSPLFFPGAQTLTATVGVPFTKNLTPIGAFSPFTVTMLTAQLPPGLSFTTGPPAIAGTPTMPGSYTSTFRVTDATSRDAYAAITINVNPVTIGSLILAPAYQGLPYSATLTGTGVGGTLTWELVGGPQLPPGLTLAADGTISGTPTVSCCTYFFTVRATDTLGQTATKTVSIEVQQPLNITTTTLGDGVAGETYYGCIAATGGVGSRTWSLSGSTPIGLSINATSGCFNVASAVDALRQGGTFSFDVNVTDSSLPVQQSDTQSITIKVHAADQHPSQSGTLDSVALQPSRRVAQVYRASSPFPLSGIRVYTNVLSCNAGAQITARVWPVTGIPPRPDESGSPLTEVTVTTNPFGYVPASSIAFPAPVAIPQGGLFAVVLSFSDNCSGGFWPSSDYYRHGDAWTSDNLSTWQPAHTTIARFDLPIGTLVMPPSTQRFTGEWLGGHAAVTLPTGRVLLVGSDVRAELFNPDANTLVSVPGTLVERRDQATATGLDNANVLIVGGRDFVGNQSVAVATTKIYQTPPPHLPNDPGSFAPGPALTVGRFGHRATRLKAPDNRVLITGGFTYDGGNNQVALDTALIFSADGSSFTTVNMTGARASHSATLLDDGRVLIVGGWTGSPFPQYVAEVFDPGTDTFTAIPVWPGKWPAQHTATVLTTGTHAGKVLITPGSSGNYPELDPISLLFDPLTDTFSSGPTLQLPRFDHTATRLSDGRVVFTGGVIDWFNYITSPMVEIYDPVADTSTLAGNLITDRQLHSATLVMVGGIEKLAVSGGYGSGLLGSKTIEVVDPSPALLTITTAQLPPGTTSGTYLAAPLGASGGAGGYTFEVVFGALPPGLSLASNGDITGTPTAGGIHHFVVKVTDSASNAAYHALTLTVDKLAIQSPTTLPTAVAGDNYSYQLLGTGSGTLTWTLESWSTLPGTLTLSPSGLLSGVGPATPAWTNFSIRITDESNQVTVRNFNLQFIAPMQLLAGTPFLGVTNEFYHYQVQPQDPVYPVTFALNAGTLPATLVLDENSGQISGFPRRTGTFDVTIRATDSLEPPQTADRQVIERIVAVDQTSGGGPGANVSIHSTQTIAQTLTVRANAPIHAVRAPITCDVGVTLTISLRNVNANGTPGSTTLASATFQSPMPLDQKFAFATPAFLRNGERVAVVFEAPNPGCTMDYPSVGDTYAGGASYYLAGALWVPFSGYEDFWVQTLVDVPGLWFSQISRGTPRVNRGPESSMVITSDFINTAGKFDAEARTLVDLPAAGIIRARGTATLVGTGMILLAGGYDGNNVTNHAEVYNLYNGTTTPTGNSMVYARQNHTATLLADGKVLIAGGDLGDGTTFVRAAEIYDPVTNTFSDACSAPCNMMSVRILHQATLLPGGNVLITGGATDTTTYYDAEVFTPGSGFAAVGGSQSSMAVRRMNHRDVALEDGRVLVTGGQNFDVFAMTATMEIYDEGCDCFTAAGSMTVPRGEHTATLTTNGLVVIAGGQADPALSLYESSYEVVETLQDFRVRPGGHLGVARRGHAAINLCPEGGCGYEGQVLLVGGSASGADTYSVEVIDPATDLLPIAAQGQSYSAGVVSPPGTSSWQMISGNVPPGLSFNPANGAITGTPSAAGTYHFTVKSEGSGTTLYQSLAIEVVTPPSMPGPGDILISEVRAENGGPVDFIELYNNTDFDFTVVSSDATSGWALVNRTGTAYQLLYVPNGTVIKARGHYLGSEDYGTGIPTEPMSYAGLAGINRANGTESWGAFDGYRVPADTGIALFTSTNNANWSEATRLDAVGFTSNLALYKEGAGLPPTLTISEDYAWVRRMRGFVAQDTDDNVADFELVAVTADTFNGVDSQLGSSGAEHSNAPRHANLPGAPGLRITDLDPGRHTLEGPNFFLTEGSPVPNGDIGIVEFRRVITNHTGQPITRLRLRVLDISTIGGDPGDADLRVLDAPNIDDLELSDGSLVDVIGATLDEPPAQALGGGRNSSLSIAIPGGTLAPGASLPVVFRLGRNSTGGGQFRFVLDVPIPGARGYFP